MNAKIFAVFKFFASLMSSDTASVAQAIVFYSYRFVVTKAECEAVIIFACLWSKE